MFITVRPVTFVLAVVATTALAPSLNGQQRAAQDTNVQTLVSRLDLARYKATIEALGQFGDRRQGTKRNRDAVDWIEAQLRSYGCTNVERLTYQYPTPRRPGAGAAAADDGGAGDNAFKGSGPGGSMIYGRGRRPTVNRDLMKQPDPKIRALNQEEPVDGERQEVYCTKVGSTTPGEMYIVSGHMDGHGVNQGTNDDASGTALVMELARIVSAPGVRTDRSIRFVLWNNEETGGGASSYVLQRASRQGIEDPPGSGRYPEPRWLGMIQHDMMMFDHGAPGPDGRVSPTQRREADVNIEFQTNSKMAKESMALAFMLKAANEAYATDYPAAVGPHMTNTDSNAFQDVAPAISVREAERGAEIGGGWDPHGHMPTDVFTTYTDADFKLGLNAAQTTLAAVAQLAGAKVSQ